MKKKNNEYQSNYESWLAVGKTFLKCQRTMNRLLLDLGISIAQHEILLTLSRHEPITHKELAEKLLVVKSNVSNLIKKLEHQSLVSVTSWPADKRVKHIRLTEAGKQLVKKSSAVQETVVTAMMHGVSSDDLLATNRVMFTAMSSLDQIA